MGTIIRPSKARSFIENFSPENSKENSKSSSSMSLNSRLTLAAAMEVGLSVE
ncbi:hypothetical protein Hanom_Chr09g00822431 [Helianthus anomalus]